MASTDWEAGEIVCSDAVMRLLYRCLEKGWGVLSSNNSRSSFVIGRLACRRSGSFEVSNEGGLLLGDRKKQQDFR